MDGHCSPATRLYSRAVWYFVKEAYQPHGNLIYATFAAVAGILGGCDRLTIVPENASHPTQIRVARNVSSILREESFLSKVADPLAGSYFIDSVVEQIVEKFGIQLENVGVQDGLVQDADILRKELAVGSDASDWLTAEKLT